MKQIKGAIPRAIVALEHAKDMIAQAYGEDGQEGAGYSCPHIEKALTDLRAVMDEVPDLLSETTVQSHRLSMGALALELPSSIHESHSLLAAPIHEAAALLQQATEERT